MQAYYAVARSEFDKTGQKVLADGILGQIQKRV
jgi:hypothetical protein